MCFSSPASLFLFSLSEKSFTSVNWFFPYSCVLLQLKTKVHPVFGNPAYLFPDHFSSIFWKISHQNQLRSYSSLLHLISSHLIPNLIKKATSLSARTRLDGRCGAGFHAPGLPGIPGACSGRYGACCSNEGWCGSSQAHCSCVGCVDYRYLMFITSMTALPAINCVDNWHLNP